ncbi:MFS transporter [Aggregatibacter aphrophilus]|uniref:MFS transporter n=1 Tax=Aggregatibacter aphrophilus TaxID=732 RepID=UPI0028EF9D96|nr:MFS transporter [Aggregatibacter aphrophilus]
MATSIDTSSKSKFNFGSRGWIVIIFQASLFWVMAGCVTHGLNVILPALSELYQLDYNELLFFVTPASWASIPAAPFFAWIIEKKGIKFNIIFSIVMTAICFGALGYCSSILSFTLLFAGVCFFGTGAAYIGGTALIANWFVKKQSLALGFTTFGQTFSSAFFVPVLSMTFAVFGVQHGFWSMSVIMAVLIVVAVVFITGKPEEQGLLPDNEPYAEEKAKDDIQKKSYLTYGMLAKSKDAWFMGVSLGGVYIMLVGIASQIVPRLISIGYEPATAISYMSACALLGTFGAYGWGWLNNKVGIKPALLTYIVWWMVAIGFNLFESPVCLLVSMIMIGLALPGATNYFTSFIATKYPRQHYVKALGFIHTLQSTFRCCAFSILAFGLAYLGGYSGAYGLLIATGVISFVLVCFTNTTPIEDR